MGGRQPSIVGRGGHIVIVLSGRSELGLGCCQEDARTRGAPRPTEGSLPASRRGSRRVIQSLVGMLGSRAGRGLDLAGPAILLVFLAVDGSHAQRSRKVAPLLLGRRHRQESGAGSARWMPTRAGAQ